MCIYKLYTQFEINFEYLTNLRNFSFAGLYNNFENNNLEVLKPQM